MDKLKLFYNTVLSSCFSPCGGYFLSGNIYGDIVLYDVKSLLNYNEDLSKQSTKIQPKSTFKTNNGHPVHSMVCTDNFFITGTVRYITGWEWNSVISGNPKTSWTIHIPKCKDVFENTEINCLTVGHVVEGNAGMVLFAGCGDNNVYAFSLEDGTCLRSYEEHTDYIHSISTIDASLASGSEDGCVRIWDARSTKCADVIYPYKYDEVKRPRIGNWIGAVCMNEDWLLCGGGPYLSLWSRRMNRPFNIFSNTDDEGIHVAQFIEDKIFAGGVAPFFSHLGYDNKLYSKIPISSSTIYCCSYQRSPTQMLILGGNSNKFDLCSNLSYRDFTFSFS